MEIHFSVSPDMQLTLRDCVQVIKAYTYTLVISIKGALE